MKRILFVAASLRVGGMERVLVDIANALSERGYSVTIITYEDSGTENFIGDLNSNIRFYYRKPREFKLRKRMPYIHRYYRPNKWETRASAKALYKYYIDKNIKYDVEIAFCRGPAVKIISGSSNKTSKKLTWVHNDYKLINQKTITKFFESWDSMRKAYEVFDWIIAVSNQAGQIFNEVIGYPDKTITIYNMLDLESIIEKSRITCPINKKRFTIISVARLIPAKGHDKLLRVVKKLNAEKFEFDLWILGTGNMCQYEVELKRYAEENHLSNVFFCGKQMNPYCYMNQADLYICTSHIEGFSISIAEAMACGLPVISTKCTGPTEILEDGKNGLLIECNEKEIYRTLKRVLIDPTILLPYKEKSIQRSKYFSSERIIDSIISLF